CSVRRAKPAPRRVFSSRRGSLRCVKPSRLMLAASECVVLSRWTCAQRGATIARRSRGALWNVNGARWRLFPGSYPCCGRGGRGARECSSPDAYRRFTQPLDMNAARHVAEQWWTVSDVVQAFPDAGTVRQFLTWLQQFSMGRKRLLDTLLAATYRQAGIQSLLTTNQSDFLVFGVFTCIAPRGSGTNP